MRTVLGIAFLATSLAACGGKKKDPRACTGDDCVDTVRAPELDQLLPGATANNNGPFVRGSADAGLTVRIYDDEACENVRGSGTAEVFATTGIQVPVLDDSTTTFRARAERDDGRRSACSASSLTYVEDSTPPMAPTIIGASPALSNANTTTLLGDAADAATVRVYADPGCAAAPIATGDAATFASSGIAITTEDDTTVTLRAQSVDAVGNASPCSATAATYVEDSTPPVFAGLVAAVYDGSGAALSWDPAPEEVVYEVCRADARGGCDAFVVHAEVTATSYSDDAVASAATYYYRVGARDAAGNLATPRAERAVYIGCGPGFVPNGSGCTWQHGPANWDFDTIGAWTEDGLPAQFLGGSDGCAPGAQGYVLIDRAATCGSTGLRQSVDMPTFEQAGGMVLAVGYYYDQATPCPDRCSVLDENGCNEQYTMCVWSGSTCVNNCALHDEAACASTYGCVWNGSCQLNRYGERCQPSLVRARVGERSLVAEAIQAPVCSYTSACLGDGQYGGPREVALATVGNFSCNAASDTEIRPARLTHVSIEPASYCPAPGEAYNGELDFDATGYGFPTGNTFEQGLVGDQGSRAARLGIGTRCGRVGTSTWYSVPTALTAPALELWLSRGAGSEVDLTLTEGLGGLRLPANATGTQRICLPPGTRGGAFPLSVFGSGPGDSLAGPGSNCSDAFATFVVLDSIRLASDPRCTTTTNVVNGDFETVADDLTTWWFNWSPAEAGGPQAFPAITRGGAGRASDAAGHAQLDQCGQATMTTAIAVPPPAGGAGAAVRAYYKYSTSGDGIATVGGAGVPQNALPPAADWTLTTVCLPPTTDPATVTFGLTRFTACGGSSSQELWIDDVEVVNDPSCP